MTRFGAMVVRAAGRCLSAAGTLASRNPARRLAAFAVALAIVAPLPLRAPAAGHAPPRRAPVASSLRSTSEEEGGFLVARAPYRFSFPRDHAAHDRYASEWWYYTGHLSARDGRRFGFELTFFRIGLRAGDPPVPPGESRWRGNELFPAHFAITDERGRRFVHYERFAREALGAGFASARTLDVRADGWSLRGTERGGRFVMRMHAGVGGDALSLVVVPAKPPALHGHGGISKKASCASCASHYYSYTRLATNGTLTTGGSSYAVSGISWMDHEFGSDELQASQAGWDWFALQLDDGRDVMLYRLRQKDGSVTPQSSGSLVARDGRVRYLPLDAFSTDATGSWTSPHTGGTYPSGWRVRIPSAGIDLVATPVLLDQELANTAGGVSYWEGAVDLRDAAGRHVGLGYVELTGYASAISL